MFSAMATNFTYDIADKNWKKYDTALSAACYYTNGGMMNSAFCGASTPLQFYCLHKRSQKKMAGKFKKLDKEFLLTNSSVNCYGYRLLTSGYLMSEFEKNPIGYYMHQRDKGVLVKWTDLRLEGDCVYGKPCINLSHERGQQTVEEIENGFLNAASFGHFVVLGISDNPADYLADQTGPSVNKWYNRECSLVDIPGNFEALTDLFDANDNPIKLADLLSTQQQNLLKMKKVFLTAEQLGKMNLKAETADEAAVEVALADLVAKAGKVDSLLQDLAAATKKATDAETALANLKAETVTAEVTGILNQALNGDKKITKAMHDQLAADYATNPAGLKKLVDGMPAFQSITKAIEESKGKLGDLASMTWEALDKAGKLADLKAADPELFKAKYKEQFGKEPA